MRNQRLFSIAVKILSICIVTLTWSSGVAYAGIYNTDAAVTYKEYWVPHSQFKGGRAEDANGAPLPGCIDTDPTGYSWYLEPAGNCLKTVTLNIPDNFQQALKVELYLDLWRSREVFSAQYQINGNAWRTATAGHDWSRSPYVAEIPASELQTGNNTFTFKNVNGAYHIHDAAVRIYFDDAHPLLDSGGNPISAPDGELVSVWADNGALAAGAGGALTVNDDQLVLTANITTQAKYVEFHGFYRGYDRDANDLDSDHGALDTEWQNRGRNNFSPGGLEALGSGGTIDHIGTVETPKPGQYSVWWPIPTVMNQSDVRFKIRIVDANGVVREAAGGVSAPFTLSRSANLAAHWINNFQDAILYSGGTKPISQTRSINISSNLANYQEAYLIGSFWSNPKIALNGYPSFEAFAGAADDRALSVQKLNMAQLIQGTNQIVYSHNSGFGEFIEKPGPLVILKPTTQAADTTAPAISNRSPAANATNVANNTPLVVSIADAGRGVNFNKLKLQVNGTYVDAVLTGTPDEYTLTYTPVTGWQAGKVISVRVEACDFAGKCMTPATYSFTIAPGAYTVTTNTVGNGSVGKDPLQATYNYGDVITLTATPAVDSEFSSWTSTRSDWWNQSWDYRLPLTVSANGYVRTDRPVEKVINFTPLLSGLGQNGALDLNSLRVIEVDASGLVVDNNVPFQFDPASNFDVNSNAAGTLILLVKGTTAAAGVRTYQVYFDVVGKGFVPPQLADQVILTSGADEFEGSYLVQAANAAYAYHVEGGGFSSLVDVDGNDWINYHESPGDAGGAFRGVPNLVPPNDSLFHPGKTGQITTLVSSGPLKETFRSETIDGKWAVQWEIYPTYATMTVLKRPSNKNYWWLYEGTPGGKLEDNTPTGKDFWTLADGTTNTTDIVYNNDLPTDEWLYISDPDVDNSSTAARSIFLIHHSDDNAIDSYHPQAVGNTSKRMAIWGFGRASTGTTTYLSEAPNRFSLGLMDATTYGPSSQIVNDVYRNINVTLGSAEARAATYNPGASAVITLTVTGNTQVTATFAPAGSQFELNTNIVGTGAVTRNPNQALYAPGQQVTVTAAPAPGWLFNGWSGALSGAANPTNITMSSDKTVTATFVAANYPVNITVIGSGTVGKSPNQANYPYNSLVTLTATPQANWHFAGWSGSLVSGANPTDVIVDGVKNIVATFAQDQVTLTRHIVGSGVITATPQQATYAYGTQVTLTASAATGWAFIEWRGDFTDTASTTTIAMDGNKEVTATFALAEYTLQRTVDGDGSVTADPDQATYHYTDVVSLTAHPAPGWLFSNWVGDVNPGDSTLNPLSVPMTTSKALQATFTAITYTLDTPINGSGVITVTPNQPSYLYSDVVTLTATAQVGWYFTGWSGDLTTATNPITTVITANQVITANFAPIYTVAVTAQGKGAVAKSPDKSFYFSNEPLTVTATANTGWLFDHWAGDLSGSTNPGTTVITSNRVITGVFTAIPYTLTVTTSGDGFVTPAPDQATYIYSDTVTLTASPATGWDFAGWSGALSGVTNPATLTITGSQAVAANFVRQPVTLTTTIVGGGDVNAHPAEPYLYGDVVTLTAASDAGWHFGGWSGDVAPGQAGQNPITLTLDGAKNVTATFIQEQYTLGVSVTGSGSVKKTPEQPTYVYGQAITLTAEPLTGWFFTGWGGAINGSASPASLVITGNMTVNATFTQTPYEVTRNTVGSGSIELNPNQNTYTLGDQVTVTAKPSPGWLFDSWSGSLTGSDNPTTLQIDSNEIVTATFTAIEYTLTTSTVGGGSLTVDPLRATYHHGDHVTLTAVADGGSPFTGWGGDLNGDINPITIVMDGNKNIVANFSQSSGVLSTSVVGNGQLLVDPDKALYNPGEVVTLTAIADVDWVFSGWNGLPDGSPNPATVVMSGNRTVVANFSEYAPNGVAQSDDFNHCTYSSQVWTWNNPRNDAAAPTVNGEEIALTVPGGTAHDVWKGGIQAPHLMQNVADGDFDVVVKFNSTLAENIQMNGILAKQDDQTAFRANFQYEKDKIYLFVGLLQAGQSPQKKAKIAITSDEARYLRVQRVGNQWTTWYKAEGGEWTTEDALSFSHEITVNSVGVFVGNAESTGSSAPAFTALLDYFVNSAQPLPAEDPLANYLPVNVVGNGTVTQNPACGSPVQLTATADASWKFVRWDKTDANGTQTLGDANPLTVSFRKGTVVTAVFASSGYILDVQAVGNGEVQVDPSQAEYTPGQIVSLTALPQPGSIFMGWSGDLSGAANPATLTMDNNKNVTAQFGVVVELTIIPPGDGGAITVSPQQDHYVAGQKVTFTAVPNPGYEFSEWIVNGVVVSAQAGSSENPLELVLSADTTVEARFAPTASPSSALYLPLVGSP